MSKRQLVTDLGELCRLPVTQTPERRGSEGVFGETLPQYNARIAREAKENEEKQAAALKSATDHAQAEMNSLLQESNSIHKELTKRFWGTGTVPKRREWSNVWLKDEVLDPFVGLEDGVFDKSASQAGFERFIETAPSLTGFKVNAGSGQDRLANFGIAQSVVGGKRVTTVEDWKCCFMRFFDCGVFLEGEITATTPAVKPTPAPTTPTTRRPTKADRFKGQLDDLGFKPRDVSVIDQTISQEIDAEERNAFEAFASNLYNETSTCDEKGHLLTVGERTRIWNTCKARGLDIRNPKNLRRIVVSMAHADELPDTVLSESDKLEHYIETHNINDPEVRRTVRRWLQAINETAQIKREYTFTH